jgi:peptide subunit release factor 1 (eRF1)
MKLSGRSDLDALTGFKGHDDLVTSFYLGTDRSSLTRKEIQVFLKNMLTAARLRIESMDAAREKKESLGRDLDLISDYCSRHLAALNAAGLAFFSCGRREFWRALELPQAPPNRCVFDTTFYIRPLDAILARYSRVCVLLLGRREAKWDEISMGEIRPLDSLSSDVPGKIKEGGFEGTESKRIERHVDARLHDHFKRAAQKTFELFKSPGFDWLFVGYEDNHHVDFESLLHNYVRDKLKARMKARPGDAPAKVLKEALGLEAGLKKAAEEETVRKLVAELERGGRASSGLKDTLASLNQFELQTLVVSQDFSKQGRMCPTHKFLYVDDLQCPVCRKKTDILPDVIDEAIETSLKRNCAVKHITPPSKLDRYGHIGAFLKYKV